VSNLGLKRQRRHLAKDRQTHTHTDTDTDTDTHTDTQTQTHRHTHTHTHTHKSTQAKTVPRQRKTHTDADTHTHTHTHTHKHTGKDGTSPNDGSEIVTQSARTRTRRAVSLWKRRAHQLDSSYMLTCRWTGLLAPPSQLPEQRVNDAGRGFTDSSTGGSKDARLRYQLP
jgi:hypothetical protein